MEENKCPVDRDKLLIGLECCRNDECLSCPYHGFYLDATGCNKQANDCLAYIGYLEELLGVTG